MVSSRLSKSDGDCIRCGNGLARPPSRDERGQSAHHAHRLLLVAQPFAGRRHFARVEHREWPVGLDDAFYRQVDRCFLPLRGPRVAHAVLDGRPKGRLAYRKSGFLRDIFVGNGPAQWQGGGRGGSSLGIIRRAARLNSPENRFLPAAAVLPVLPTGWRIRVGRERPRPGANLVISTHKISYQPDVNRHLSHWRESQVPSAGTWALVPTFAVQTV